MLRVFLLASTLTAAALAGAPPESVLVYVGSSGSAANAIYSWRFEPSTGETTPIGLVAETPLPSFLAIHPTGLFLYAANAIGNYNGGKAGSLSAFAIDAASGKLTPLNRVSSAGGGPAFVTVDVTGRWALAANYGGGSVAVLPIRPDGRLGEATSVAQHHGSSVNAERQTSPHAHSVNVSPDGRFALVPDLGIDQVLIYRFDAVRGIIAANDPASVKLKPGAGPRHLSFHPGGKYVYLVSELAGTITVFAWDAARGALTELQAISSVPEGSPAVNSSAEVQVHPNGRFVYASNRGPDDIAVFRVDPSKGTLTFVERVPTRGKKPRNFRLDPSGRWLFAANQDSNTVVVFRVDPETGRLTPSGRTMDVPSPACVKFAAR
jgi:6-phosphogluconolactonase